MTLFPAGPPPPRPVTLVRLSAEIARASATVGRVAVEGEVHRPSRRPGGRVFFTLKDRAAQITVTCPASRARRCRAVAGERVRVTASLEWVSQWGALQLVAEEVVPVGEGAVAAAIAESRARLAAEGLLSRPRRAIPRLPGAIGVVCGSEAAVRGDIESVVAARFPGYPLVFREVTVSGPGAADAVTEAVLDLDARSDVDVIVLARGGGDSTQLLPFSDEDLCRVLCNCRAAVVSAIGHEGDRPLCDEVADLRCGTPSLAAAEVVPNRAALEAELAVLLSRADASVEHRAAEAGRRLALVDRDRAVTVGVTRAAERLARAAGRLELVHPGRSLPASRTRLERCDWRSPMRSRLGGAGTALGAARRQMDALHPARVLERGYAVVRSPDGSVVRGWTQVAPGERVTVELAAGRLGALVEQAGPVVGDRPGDGGR